MSPPSPPLLLPLQTIVVVVGVVTDVVFSVFLILCSNESRFYISRSFSSTCFLRFSPRLFRATNTATAATPASIVPKTLHFLYKEKFVQILLLFCFRNLILLHNNMYSKALCNHHKTMRALSLLQLVVHLVLMSLYHNIQLQWHYT